MKNSSTRLGVRSKLIDLLRHKSLGAPAATLARFAGSVDLDRKISSICGHVPSVVVIEPPAALGGGRRFRMNGVGGHEGVARTFHWGGWGGYERPFPDLFAACSKGARTVLDVGAFSGLYGLIAATCEPQATIRWFEPYPYALGLLEANVRLNHLEGRGRIVPKAVSDHVGEADLTVPTTQTELIESACSINGEIYDSQFIERIKVSLVSLDEYLAEEAIPPVDLIKIDVETYEPAVLRGAAGLLRGDRPVIFQETLPNADLAALEAIRTEFDYMAGVLVVEGVRLEDPIHHAEGRYDHVWYPREKHDAFRSRVESAGYRIFDRDGHPI